MLEQRCFQPHLKILGGVASNEKENTSCGACSCVCLFVHCEGYNAFSKNSICYIHKKLFEDVYDWAGKYRTINIFKREELLARSAGYVRNSFVLASFGKNSEYEYLERILKDAICKDPIIYNNLGERIVSPVQKEAYDKYVSDKYVSKPHSYIE